MKRIEYLPVSVSREDLARNKGSDVFQKGLDKLGLELHLPASIVPPKRMSFSGPGTRLDKRLNPDGSWKEWSKPHEWDKYGTNALDYGCYKHDLAYFSPDDRVRRLADKELVQDAKRWKAVKEANNDMGLLDKANYLAVGMGQRPEVARPNLI
jgi:hypothetical protein